MLYYHNSSTSSKNSNILWKQEQEKYVIEHRTEQETIYGGKKRSLGKGELDSALAAIKDRAEDIQKGFIW